MGVIRALRPAVAAALFLGLTGCGQGGFTGMPLPRTTSSEAAASEGLVLRVQLTGGFGGPSVTAGRLPLVSVYADGRVISEGPVPAIYPGPALPAVQQRRIDRTAVQDLVDRALAAGVAETADLGSTRVADAPSTRVTVITATHAYAREVYALSETPTVGGGLTEGQQAARAKLRDLVTAVTAVTEPLPGGVSVPYQPTGVAALITPWADRPHGPAQPDVAWPGPELPGAPTAGRPDAGCVSATGDQARAILTAAGRANGATPWVTPDGSRWSVTFRPLLPDESGCADLSH